MKYDDSIPASILNTAFIEKIENGFIKEAAQSGSDVIRKEIHEGSFLTKILPEEPITAGELDKDEDLDILKKIVEREPKGAATWASFDGLPAQRFLTQGSGVIYFAQIMTDKTVKNKVQLMTRSNDVRKILADNNVSYILEQQDGKWIEMCQATMAAYPAQDLTKDDFTFSNFAESLGSMVSSKLKINCVLMNEQTRLRTLPWNADSVGDATVTKHYEGGITETDLLGVKCITTLKTDLVPDYHVWYFTEPEYLGKFYTLRDATLHIEDKGDHIIFHTTKYCGMSAINTNGIIRCDFTPTP